MNLYNVLLNNKIPFILSESDTSENIIYCNSFSDYLFNIGVFSTKGKEVVLEYFAVKDEKYAKLDLTFENGECFKGVEFKIIITNKQDIPYSTFNKSNLGTNKSIIEKIETEEIVEETTLPELENVDVITKEQLLEIKNKKAQYENATKRALEQEKKFFELKKALKQKKVIIEKNDTIKSTIANYKQELLEEYVNAVVQQKEILQTQIKENLLSAEQELHEKISNTFADYDISFEDYKDKTRKEQLEFILDKINTSIVQTQQNLNTLVESKFTKEQGILLNALGDKSHSLQEKYEQKLLIELEKYKEELFEEFHRISNDSILNILTEKKELTEKEIIEVFTNREKQFAENFEDKLKAVSAELNETVQRFDVLSQELQEKKKLTEQQIINTFAEKERQFTTSFEDKLKAVSAKTFTDYEIQLEDYKNNSRKEQLDFILDKVDNSIFQIQKELNDLIDNKFTLEQDQLVSTLHSKAQSLQEKYEQKLILELEQYKETLFEEFSRISEDKIAQELQEKGQLTEQQIINTFAEKERQFTTSFEDKLKAVSAELNETVQRFDVLSQELQEKGQLTEQQIINTFAEKERQFTTSFEDKLKAVSAELNETVKKVTDKLPSLGQGISELESRVKKLIEEKDKSEEAGKFNTTQQKYITDTAQYWARRILELGGGGGTVAVQYANGGTMDGNLNVTGNYLSGGVNLLDIFTGGGGGGGGDPAVNALVHTNSGYWENAYTNLVTNSAAYLLSGTEVYLGDIPALSGNWNSNFTTTKTNSAAWSSAYTTTNNNSGKYDSTYTTVNTYSGTWSTGIQTLGFNETNAQLSISNGNIVSLSALSGNNINSTLNYFSTNNVTISGLTVTQNLSVGGTIYSLASALVIAKYETLIGNGVNTSFTVNHNLNTYSIQVVVYDVSNNIASYPSIQILNSNSVSIGFSFVLPSNSYRVLVFGTVPSNQINAYGQIYTVYTTATGFGDIPVLSGNWNSTFRTVSSLSAIWSQAGTAAYTVTADNFIITQSSSWAVNTTSKSITGILPPSPSSGMTIRFLDAAKTWGDTNRSFVIVRSGQSIESLSENINCDISGYSFSLTYIGGSIGWRLY